MVSLVIVYIFNLTLHVFMVWGRVYTTVLVNSDFLFPTCLNAVVIRTFMILVSGEQYEFLVF